MDDFKNIKFPIKNKTEVVFMNGGKEIPLGPEKTKNRYGMWAGKKKMVIVPNAEHDIGSGDYLKDILEEIKKAK